jgi:hypothetical protein
LKGPVISFKNALIFIGAMYFKEGLGKENNFCKFKPAKIAFVKIYHICLACSQLLTVILLKCSFGSKVKVQMPDDEVNYAFEECFD